MPEAASSQQVERRPEERQEATNLFNKLFVVIQLAGVFFAGQYFIGRFFNKQPTPPKTITVSSPVGGDRVITVPTVVPKYADKGTPNIFEYSPTPQLIAPIWEANSSLDIMIWITPQTILPPLTEMHPSSRMIFNEKGFKLGNYQDQREASFTLAVPLEVQRNETWWMHTFVGLSGWEIGPYARRRDPGHDFYTMRPLNQVLPKRREHKKKNLLSGKHDEKEEIDDSAPKYSFVSYYHPNISLSFVPDSSTLEWPSVHPAIKKHILLDGGHSRDDSGQHGWYYPPLFWNTFWQLRSHMIELNDTVKTVPLQITLNNMPNWKMSIYSSIDEGMKHNQRQIANGGPIPAGGDGGEFEEFKRVLVDTNIYLLSTTAVVSVLHMLFEALAFKSDISHWRNKKDNIGVSVRTILANVLMQSIIFLYLMDNSDGTSWMILFGQGMSIVLEAWKITKTVNVRIRAAAPGRPLPYRLVFEDKHKLSETEEKTKEYDAIAFRYMYIIAVPLLAAYAVYSVVYDDHKGWYSFVITTMVGSVYAYGFLMMVPSLYINYRLKSVAHMPAKAMTYKFLNTFIDDLFAFTIKMPTLHRLATLRDDVIFFVYLYQSYAYKVDFTRVNEFGQVGDVIDDKKVNGEQTENQKGKALLASEIVSHDTTSALNKVQDQVAAAATGTETKAAKRRKGQ